MFALSPALQLLLMMFAGWVNRHQLRIIEYLKEENRVLKERLDDRPIHFTDAERRRLARKAKVLGRKVLRELQTLVTPDTLLRWYRELVSSQWDYSQRRGPGRPRVMKDIVDLILHMAQDNPSWSSFLKAHWDCLAATDFSTVEVLTLTGLVTHYVLFFIDIATRSVHILDDTGGTQSHRHRRWVPSRQAISHPGSGHPVLRCLPQRPRA